MILNFLSAKVPLTKTFTASADGSIEKSPYPLVRDFTSYEEHVTTIQEFHTVVQAHALEGHCLLKGKLNRTLINESRAGATNPVEPTEWICFDLDNIEAIDTVDRFINNVLPSCFHDASYVLQHSASAGVSTDTGLRAHLFFLLSRQEAPELLKLFVTALNLEAPLVNGQLALTAAGTSLRYPVDRSVNQNDKLIYISPPSLVNITDKLAGKRISLELRAKPAVTINWSQVKTPAQVEQLVADKVAKLRETTGLKTKHGKHRTLQTGEILLTNPDVAAVTGARQGRGFVYLNLNGGDSWAYYYPIDNPQYVYNFKGEPVVELAAIAPTYWAQIQNHMQQNPQVDARAQPFVFRRHESDSMYAGVWDSIKQCFVIPPAQIKRESIDDFYGVYSQEPPNPIAHWQYEFDPTNNVAFDPVKRFCNMFELSSIMKNPTRGVQNIPPTIDKVIRSVVANDTPAYNHFINWLACIYQKREKTGTAWVFHGVEGTGKGVLFSEVLAPMFGKQYCSMRQIGNLEDKFNADLEHCLFLVVDEARIEDSSAAKRTLNRIKNLITEEDQCIRGMRSNAVQVKNFSNLLFYSNDYDSLAISPTDRRFNVAPRQERKLELAESEMLAIQQELPSFAGFLAEYAADAQLARTALNNDAKRQLREASQDALEQLCQAITDGDLAYFMQYIETGGITATTDLTAWSQYLAVMRNWLNVAGNETVVTRDDIKAAYLYLMAPSNVPGPHKFGRMLAHKNLVMQPRYVKAQGVTVRGVPTIWKATPEQVAAWTRIVNPSATAKQPSQLDANVSTWNKSLSA